MAGAIAGTAILRAPERSDRVHTIALTINNRCNLTCPHCYLQYQGLGGNVGEEVLEAVLSTPFQHLAIVGKEPFVDAASVALVGAITSRMQADGRTVSVITNGLSLSSVPAKVLAGLAYVDVSLDGGPNTYHRYRAGSLAKLKAGLKHASRFVELNALHVISSATLPYIDDMAAAGELAPFQRVMFSPYLVTSNHGLNSVDPIDISVVLRSLAKSSRFRSCPNAFLLIDGLHLQASNHQEAAVLAEADLLGIAEQVRVISCDPASKGFLRVNYDGLVLAPLDSLSPALYANCATHVSQGSLESIFARMRAA